MGSLVAAVGSYLDARSQGGEWLVRMEDLDPPREREGAADQILRTLEAFGMEWDGSVLYQSDRQEAYADAASDLLARDRAYPCSCSRKEVAAAGITGFEGAVYPGFCRHKGHNPERNSKALRAKTWPGTFEFNDLIHGPIRQDLHTEIGDFIIRRADGFTAYQLAVVVDDACQGITRVVRGSDLLTSTARQIHLQHQLHLPAMEYAHLPLVLDEQGNKLSKQSLALPVGSKNPVPALVEALRFLGQPVPETPLSLPDLWTWAISHWDLSQISV